MIKVLRESTDNLEVLVQKFVDDCKKYDHRDANKVKKRIASTSEFDNGYVMHSDWKKMTALDAEKQAREISKKDPDKTYYVAYDDVMIGASDFKWKNGQIINRR